MIGGYTFKPLSYVVHHRGVWLFELIEAPLDKYVGKDKAHMIGLINL